MQQLYPELIMEWTNRIDENVLIVIQKNVNAKLENPCHYLAQKKFKFFHVNDSH